MESSDEFVPVTPPLSPEMLKPILQDMLDNYKIGYNISDEDVTKISETINQPYNYTLEVAQKIKPEGAWASVLHNVMVVDQSTIEIMVENILQQVLKEVIQQANSNDLPFWVLPYTKFGLKPKLAPYIS